MEPFSCPEFGLPLASGASRCSAPQPGTVYLPRYEPPNCRWAPSSAWWRLSFSSMREPSSGAVVTEQRVRRRIQISGLNSTQTLKVPTLQQCLDACVADSNCVDVECSGPYNIALPYYSLLRAVLHPCTTTQRFSQYYISTHSTMRG